MRAMVDEALASLDARFESAYATLGRPSIAPERLLRALLRIPDESGQPFRPKLDSDSGGSWTLNPDQPGQ